MLSIQKQYEAYQQNAVTTASSGQLTLMLYNGCIKFIKQAIIAVNEKDYESKNEHIQKAQNIVQELMLTLDQKIDISQQIMPLYEYANYQLIQGNVKNDVSALEEALHIMTEFRDTWKEVILRTGKNKLAEQGVKV